jgi:hypothetical protein
LWQRATKRATKVEDSCGFLYVVFVCCNYQLHHYSTPFLLNLSAQHTYCN